MGINRVSLRVEARSRRRSQGALQCREKFLRFFPDGFADETYDDWERGYKARAHEQWNEQLGKKSFETLLAGNEFAEIASRAVRIESRTNLLFSFEKMALRDAVKSRSGARAFARGLHDFLHGKGSQEQRFERWVEVVEKLPRKQTRVLTWPIVTVFGFLAKPEEEIFLKPNVTKRAASEYGFSFEYQSRPNWDTYSSLIEFARVVQKDLSDLHPKDLIDIQSFLWVQGSDEYAE